ncbi:hypothetical protein [Citromicrobium phage vB_Cib_ssDNA_P1]|nr:hypothetical protein [Citromicrobium phage vB_Cib_ssDNA_P1]
MYLDTTGEYLPLLEEPEIKPFRGARPRAKPRRLRRGFGKRTGPPAFPELAPARGIATKGMRVIPVIGGIMTAAEILDALTMENPEPLGMPAPWYKAGDCGTRPCDPPYVRFGGQNSCAFGPYQGVFGGHIFNCAASQGTPWEPWGTPVVVPANANRTIFLRSLASSGSGLIRARNDAAWWIGGTHPTLTSVPYNVPYIAAPSPLIGQPINPNALRNMPSAPPEPAIAPSTPEPVPDYWQWSNTPPGEPPPRQHQRRRPRKNEKEKKSLSRAARVGIFLWNLMDTVSELSEIGGAIYDALPEEIREKANCPEGINIGQYGSDFNACMADTLWKHWDKLDPAEMFMNIAKNVAEDMTIGAFHKFLDKMYPPGFSWRKTFGTHALAQTDMEAYIAKRLKELFTFLGLEKTEDQESGT